MSWSSRNIHSEEGREAPLQRERSLDDWITEASSSTRATKGIHVPAKRRKVVTKRSAKRVHATRTPSFSEKSSWESYQDSSKAHARRRSSAASSSRQVHAFLSFNLFHYLIISLSGASPVPLKIDGYFYPPRHVKTHIYHTMLPRALYSY